MSEMAEGKLIAAIAFPLLFAQHLVTEKKAQGKNSFRSRSELSIFSVFPLGETTRRVSCSGEGDID